MKVKVKGEVEAGTRKKRRRTDVSSVSSISFMSQESSIYAKTKNTSELWRYVCIA